MVELSLERRMREADVGSQSADTIKMSFSSRCGPAVAELGLARADLRQDEIGMKYWTAK
jgi:hypothetical protein